MAKKHHTDIKGLKDTAIQVCNIYSNQTTIEVADTREHRGLQMWLSDRGLLRLKKAVDKALQQSKASRRKR